MIFRRDIKSNKNGKYLLFGGLGNQLFQIAHGLESNPVLQVEMNRVIAANGFQPNRSLDEFYLPSRVKIIDVPAESQVTQKIMNLTLRISAKINLSQKSSSLMIFMVAMFSVILSLLRREKVKYNLGVGKNPLGYNSEGDLNIGYFQYLPLRRVLDEMSTLRLVNPSRNFLLLKDEVKNRKILSIHVRLGDYLGDQDIGAPSVEFYLQGMNKLCLDDDFDFVYVFSNDIAQARQYFDTLDFNRFVFVGEDTLSAAEAFELMRHASGYVISNSTYSWWSCILSYTNNPSVICPSPWFERLDEPIGLVPSNWIQIPRDAGS
jgi:hypothetical protein